VNKAKKKLKPSEYPSEILKVLYQHYKQAGQLTIEYPELNQLSGIPANSLYDALKIIMQEGYITEGIDGQPYFTYSATDGAHSIITLTAKGISAGEQLMRHSYYKVFGVIRAAYVATVEGVTSGSTRH